MILLKKIVHFWDLLKQIQFTGMAKMLFNRTKMQKEPSELAELAEKFGGCPFNLNTL